VGLVLSVVLLVLALSGSALVYKEAWWRVVHPELRGGPPDLTHADHAAGVAGAQQRFGEELRSVKFPEPGVPAYHLYLQDGEAFLAPDGRTVIDRWRPGERPASFLFDLHAHLLAGDAGERVGGVVALLGVVLVVSGVILWWPARRRFRLTGLLPGGLSRRQLLPSHRDMGLLATPLLLILLLTGAGIVFYGTAGALLNGLMGGGEVRSEAAPAGDGSAGLPGPESAPLTASMLADVARAFPDARPVFYYPPDEAATRPVHGFRLKRPCELHPNGRTWVYLDGAGTVLRTVDACTQPPGQRSLHALYPLHAGKSGSGPYKAAVFAGGLVLAWISASGALAYLAGLRAARRRARPPPVASPGPR
jgi:uncharacterized iron-regulated membrane protein